MINRLDTERRLLAALFLWPRDVALEPHRFVAAQHQTLFQALQELGPALLDDSQALPLLRAWLERGRDTDVFRSVGGLDEYVMTTLVPIAVTPHAIDDLVEQVRACPRCGH